MNLDNSTYVATLINLLLIMPFFSFLSYFYRSRKAWNNHVSWSIFLLLGLLISHSVIWLNQRKNIVENHFKNLNPINQKVGLVKFSDSTHFNVLILPFGSEGKGANLNFKLEKIIQHKYLELNNNFSLNIHVHLDTTQGNLETFEDVLSISKISNADLVIWGNYYNINSDELVQDNLKNALWNQFHDLDISTISNIADIGLDYRNKNTNYLIHRTQGFNKINNQNYQMFLIHKKRNIKNIPYRSIFLLSFILAYTYESIDDFETALKEYQNLIFVYPYESVLHSHCAFILSEYSNDYRGAKNHYLKALQIDPQNPYLYNNYGVFLGDHLNDSKGCKNCLLRAIELDSNVALIHSNLASSLPRESFSDFQAAMKSYMKAIEIDSSFSDAYILLALLNANFFKNNVQCDKYYLKALKIEPKSLETFYYIGLYNEKYLRNYKNAKYFYTKALETDPNYPQALISYAELCAYHLYDMQEANNEFIKAMYVRPRDATIICQFAKFVLKCFNDCTRAEQFLRKAITVSPDNARAHYSLARLLSSRSTDTTTTKKHYDIACKLNHKYRREFVDTRDGAFSPLYLFTTTGFHKKKTYKSFNSEIAITQDGFGVYYPNSKDIHCKLSRIPFLDRVEGLRIEYQFPKNVFGNWISIRKEFSKPIDLSSYDGLKLELFIPGQQDIRLRFTLVDIMKTRNKNYGGKDELWWCDLDSETMESQGEWDVLLIPFNSFSLSSYLEAGYRNNDRKLDLKNIIAYEINLIYSNSQKSFATNTGSLPFRRTELEDALDYYDQKENELRIKQSEKEPRLQPPEKQILINSVNSQNNSKPGIDSSSDSRADKGIVFINSVHVYKNQSKIIK